MQATLLSQTSQSAALLTRLGVTAMTPSDLLAQLVPAWQQLAEAAQAAALSFLVANWHSLQANERLVALLKDLPFVTPCGDGECSQCLTQVWHAMWLCSLSNGGISTR